MDTVDNCTVLETLVVLEGKAGREIGDGVDCRAEVVGDDVFACCRLCPFGATGRGCGKIGLAFS